MFSNRKSPALLLSLFFSLYSVVFSNDGPLPDINSNSDYLVYYGSWNHEQIHRAQYFDLVILDGNGITASAVIDVRNGLDDIPGTEDDVIVIAYISIGEDHRGDHTGDGTGPVRWENSQVYYTNGGYASWYVDDMDKNNLPDQNSTWGSFYVNGGDSAWQEFVRTNPAGSDFLLNTLGCDGLFLDTIDSASPWFHYRWTVAGMSQLINRLHQWYPDKYFIANRGLFYFDTSQSAYQYTIRSYVNAVMFESYYIHWNWDLKKGEVSPYFDNNKNYWAPELNAQAKMTDGFTVLSLDYLNPSQSDYSTLLENQIHETVTLWGWTNYISGIYLDEIRYDMYHQHETDTNPPSWATTLGVKKAAAGDRQVTLKWNRAVDQSEPVKYNIYYSTQENFDFATAEKLVNAAAITGTEGYDLQYTVQPLENYITYYFTVRAEDSAPAPNEDQNRVMLSVTPPADTSGTQIVIDGNFSEWGKVSQLDLAPNPVEETGDALNDDVDLLDLWIYDDAEYLYVRYKVAGSVAGGYFYHVFIDADGAGSSGYSPDNSVVGAELMIENSYLWQYTGTGGGNWGWQSKLGLLYAKGGTNNSEVEIAIERGLLNDISAGAGCNISFNINNLSTTIADDWAPDSYLNQTFHYQYITTTSVLSSAQNPKLAGQYELDQNYPNPFNPSTCIRFKIPNANITKLVIYNLLGKAVNTIISGNLKAGSYRAFWNGKDYNGRDVASGIYLYRLETGNYCQVKKLLLAR